MSKPVVGFITHHEVEALASSKRGGGQQRRRLAKRGLFPPSPGWLRADRDQLAVFPEFALAALTIGRTPSAHQAQLLEGVVGMAEKLFTSTSYRRLGDVLRDGLQHGSSQDVTGLVLFILQADPAALDAWRDDVADATTRLSRLGLGLDSTPARVSDKRSGIYVVELIDHGDTERHELHDAPADLVPGSWVTRHRFHVGSAMRDFLLPVPDPAEHRLFAFDAKAPGDQAKATDEDHFVTQLLDGPVAPRVIPYLGAARMDSGGAVAPTTKVEVPMDLLGDANTMTRS